MVLEDAVFQTKARLPLVWEGRGSKEQKAERKMTPKFFSGLERQRVLSIKLSACLQSVYLYHTVFP